MSNNKAAWAARYQERGYVVVENLLSRREIAILRERTENIAEGRVASFPPADIELEPAAEGASGADCQVITRRPRKLNRCAENDSVFLAHAGHQLVLDIAESILGPDIKLFGSQCFMKPPGGVEKPYHQDSAYFSISPMELVTCWTALDDVTLENGCMWVIPGSHREGLLDHGQEWLVGSRPDKQVPDELLNRSREVPITMPAGSCSFHHSLLLHRSGPNLSDMPRRGLAVHYMSAKSRWTDANRPQPEYLLLRGKTDV